MTAARKPASGVRLPQGSRAAARLRFLRGHGAGAIGLVAACLLGACRTDAPLAGTSAATPRPAWTAAEARRPGDWLGGPELISGKLPSGVATWWRLSPAQPQPGQPFELTVRVEGVREAGATLSLRADDGARIVRGADAGPWALPAGEASQISVRLTAPPGASYVHLQLQHGTRDATRSIALPLAGRNPADAARQRADYATDTRGEPIVRMPAEPAR